MRFTRPDGTLADGRVIRDERKCYVCGGIECLLSTGFRECEHCGHTDNPAAPVRKFPIRENRP